MLNWLIENTLIATGLAVVLLICSRWLEKRPAVGNFGWLLVIVLVVMPPVPSVVSPGVRETLMTPVNWVGGVLTAEPQRTDPVRKDRADWTAPADEEQGWEPTDSGLGYADAVDEAKAELKKAESAYENKASLVTKKNRVRDARLATMMAERNAATVSAPVTEPVSESVSGPETEPVVASTPPIVWPGAEPDSEAAVQRDTSERWASSRGVTVTSPRQASPGNAKDALPERGDEPARALPVTDEAAEKTFETAGVRAGPGVAAIGPTGEGTPINWRGVLMGAGIMGLIAWAVGAVLVGRRQAVRVGSMRAMERGSVRDAALEARVRAMAERLGVRAPRTIVSDKIDGPMVWSLGHSVLVWPSSISVDEAGVDGMIAHELAHLRRGDHWSAWLELAALTLFWWHPLVWLAHRRAREYAELACDAWVSWALPTHRRAYAEALVTAATKRAGLDGRGVPALAFGVVESSRDDFKRRLTMVMNGRGSRRLPPAFAAAGLGLVMMLAPSLAGDFTSTEPETVQIEQLDLIDSAFHPALQRMVLIEKAEQYERSGETHAAVEAYMTAIELGAKAHGDVAMMMYDAERWEDGQEAFVEAFESGDDNADHLYNAACCAALAGNERDAEKLLWRAVEAGYSDGDHMMSDSDLESVHERDGVIELAEFASAIEELEQLAQEAQNEEAWETAARAYGKLAEMRSDNGNDLHMAGYCAIMGRDFEAGRKWFGAQIEADYIVSTAKYNMACLESLAGNESDAIEWLAESIEDGFTQHQLMREDPDLDGIRDRDGYDELLAAATQPERIRREMELAAEFWDWDVVIDNAEQIIENSEDGDWNAVQARQMLAKAYEQRGDHGDAIDVLLDNAESGKNTHGTMLAIARNYAKDGKTRKGAAYLAAVIETGGNYGYVPKDEAIKELGQHKLVKAAFNRQRERDELAQFDASSWSELAEDSRQQIAENPEKANGYLMLGWSQLRMLELEDAIETFKVYGEYGSEQLAAYNIACCYAVGGNADEAFEYINKAIEAGFASPGQYADDPDFESLHDDSRWAEVISGMKSDKKDYDKKSSHDEGDWDKDWDDDDDDGDWDADEI